MSYFNIKRDFALVGMSGSKYWSFGDQFQSSIGIDPDMPETDTAVRPCGLLRPTSMAKFSDTEITGAPMFMVSNPKDTNLYVYAYDGKVHVVSSTLAMGTALNSGNAMTNASGNGACYYDNKIILAKEADIAAYTIWNTTLVQNYWTNTLSLTALTNTTYPSVNGVEMPNHVCHVHTDGACYIADVVGNIGVLHKLKTTKTTSEGDTDDGSAYNVIDFGYGYYPTAIASYDNYLLIALIDGTSTSVHQKPAKLALWDTYSDTFDNITLSGFSDPLITALLDVDGTTYVFSGKATGGCRVSKFLGVRTLEPIGYWPDMYPPLNGAVDHYMTKVIWGSKTTIPTSAGMVYSLGSLYPDMNYQMGLHGILKATAAGANPFVTAIKYFNQSASLQQPVIGWKDDTSKGLDKLSTTYTTNYFTDAIQRIGKEFIITRVRVPLVQAVAANMTLTIKAYFDNGSSNVTIGTINNTDYSGELNVDFQPVNARGKNDFYLQLEWSGSVLLTVGLPISIDLEITDD